MTADWSFYTQHGFTPVINVSGTMTALGASIVGADVARSMSEILPLFLSMHELQAHASGVLAEITGADAGMVTASASAGITLSVAAAITGMNPGHVQRLPINPSVRSEVVIQTGHLCAYGAPVSQAIELTGGKVIPIGQSTLAMDFQLEDALSERTAAAVYVVSHHVVEYGQIPLRRFIDLCQARGVPVIVDAASEYDLKGFLAAGADLVVYSAHKFMGGPTAGLVVGQRELVRAAYLQNTGIGRGMKVGKESIFGAIAALKAWEARDHQAIWQQEQRTLALWQEALARYEGITTAINPDCTGNPLNRLKIQVERHLAGFSASALAVALAAEKPGIIVRDIESELGWIQLDPCNLADGHAEIVAASLKAVLGAAARGEVPEPDETAYRSRSIQGYLDHLDTH